MHKTTTRFWSCFEDLPVTVQELARKKFALLKENSRHPSLHFKKVGRFWSARVGSNYRAVAVPDGNDFIWVWIGSHREYEQLLAQTKI
jgi:hypothetical protein